MIWFRYGDRFASVGTMQHVLNLAALKDPRLASGKPLDEDGIFGPLTLRRVREVQRALEVKPANGVLGPSTWSRLRPIVKCRVVDVTDLALEDLLERKGEARVRQELIGSVRGSGRPLRQIQLQADKSIRRYKAEIKECRAQHQRFLAMGGNPIAVTHPDGALDQIRQGVIARSQGGWKVVLLRFTGHGSPTSQGVAGSLIGARTIRPGTLRYDADDSAEDLVRTLVVSCMADPMPKWGSLELHGCSVAGKRWKGKGKNRVFRNGAAFIRQFADTVGRPVTGSTIPDLAGTVKADLRYEGGVVSCVPGGGRIGDWFRQAGAQA